MFSFVLGKRHEDVQYHFNEKHGIIFLTAVDSVHHRKRVGPNACDTENIKTGGENVHSTSPTAQSLSQVTVDATTTSASSNISHVDPEEKQTKIYIPHVVSHDINMMQLYQIQSDLFHWAQENLQNPPENEHVVLAIVDPSFTIVYYKLTKGMLNLQ